MEHKSKSIKGFTLIDVLVGAALFLIISLAISTGFQTLFKILIQSQNKTVALGLANEQIEIIRNLKYKDIGTQGGVPNGNVPQFKTETVGERTYNIATDIIYIDNSFDGKSPDDESSADYKKARIEVSWQEHGLGKSIVEITNFSPPNLESEVGGGTLSVYVKDRQSYEAIPNAKIEIINEETSPAIQITTTADNNGWLSRPGLPFSNSYQIVVTKEGYDNHQTYTESLSLDPDPEYSHAKLQEEEEKSTRYFVVSRISNIDIDTINHDGESLGEIPFTLKGGRQVGLNPEDGSVVYSYQNNSLSTDLNGNKTLLEMSPGEYYLKVISDQYAVLTPNLEKPIMVAADSIENITISLAPVDEPYLRIIVKDADTGDPIPQATVRLFNLDYDKTSNSNEDGVALFPNDEEELLNGSYTLQVSKGGYGSISAPQNVNNFTATTTTIDPL